jgi:hypothetical protein
VLGKLSLLQYYYKNLMYNESLRVDQKADFVSLEDPKTISWIGDGERCRQSLCRHLMRHHHVISSFPQNSRCKYIVIVLSVVARKCTAVA